MKVIQLIFLAAVITVISLFILQKKEQASLNAETASIKSSYSQVVKTILIESLKYKESLKFSQLDKAVKSSIYNMINEHYKTPVYFKEKITFEKENPEILIISQGKFYDKSSGLFSLKRTVHIAVNTEGKLSLITEDDFQKLNLESFTKLD